MTDEQIQALEALYTAAGERYTNLTDLDKVPFPISARTREYLLDQGLIRAIGRGSFTVTQQGVQKANENRGTPPVTEG